MKKYKIVLLIFIIFLISGCSVKYTINVDKTGRVNESISIMEKNNLLGNTDDEVKETVNIAYSNYRAIAKFKEYNVDMIYKASDSGILLIKTYNNICDYINYNGASKYIFKNMTCVEKENYYEIKNSGDYLGGCLECNDEANKIDKLYITFNLPKRAIASNADKVIKNKYIWTIDRITTQDKNFLLKIEKPVIKKNNNYDLIIYVMVIIIILPIIYLIFKTIFMALKNKN